jgi:hypothetical protein
MKKEKSGQSSMEYLLLIGGAVLIAVVVLAAAVLFLGAGSGELIKNWGNAWGTINEESCDSSQTSTPITIVLTGTNNPATNDFTMSYSGRAIRGKLEAEIQDLANTQYFCFYIDEEIIGSQQASQGDTITLEIGNIFLVEPGQHNLKIIKSGESSCTPSPNFDAVIEVSVTAEYC